MLVFAIPLNQVQIPLILLEENINSKQRLYSLQKSQGENVPGASSRPGLVYLKLQVRFKLKSLFILASLKRN